MPTTLELAPLARTAGEEHVAIEGALLVSDTLIPDGPALPVRKIEIVEVLPPTTGFGLQVTTFRSAGVTVNVVVFTVAFAAVAVKVTVWVESTPAVPTVKALDDSPLVTVKGEDGLQTEGLSLDIVTLKPLGPAGPVRNTPSWVFFPPTTEDGVHVR